MIAPGSTVDQKYWVERVVGRGGMGVVVAATHLQLGQRVALKFLHGDASYDPEAVARFLREARASVRLRSEHVGRVLDVGTHDDGAPYIVMEYLEGEDLGSLIARGGPLPITTAVDLVLQACLGLAEAHAARIVHRDLKPSNLFLTRRPDGTPLLKVLDFGIAKAHGTLHGELTASSAVMGSPPYMSPEQLRSARAVDARSDLWSLGVVLYELVTGRRPYVADSVTAMAVKIATEEPTPLPPTVPRAFAEVVRRCLQREPGRRFADVAALARALGPSGGSGAVEVATSVGRVQAGAGSGGAAGRPAPVQALMDASTASHAVSSTTTGDTVPYLARRGAFWIGIAAGAVAVAIVVITVIALRRPPAVDPPPGAGGLDDDRAALSIDAAPIPTGAATAAGGDAGVDATVAPIARDGGLAPADPDGGRAPVVRSGGHGGRGPTGVHGAGSAAGSGSAVPAGGGSGATGAGSAALPPIVTPPGCVPTPDDLNCDGIPDRR